MPFGLTARTCPHWGCSYSPRIRRLRPTVDGI